MAELITGNGQTVDAQSDADIYSGFLGADTYVLSTGNQMEATYDNERKVRIKDGVVMKEGRAIIIPANSYDEFVVPMGPIDVFDEYFIGYKIYVDVDGKEKIQPIVSHEKTETPGMRSGSSEMYVWLYGAIVTGNDIEGLNPLFGKIRSETDKRYFSVTKSSTTSIPAGDDKYTEYASIELEPGTYIITGQATFSSSGSSNGFERVTLRFENASADICRSTVAINTANPQTIQATSPVSISVKRKVLLLLSSTVKRNATAGWIKAARIA